MIQSTSIPFGMAAFSIADFDALLQQRAFEPLLSLAERFISPSGAALVRFSQDNDYVHVLLCAAIANDHLHKHEAAILYLNTARALAPESGWVHYHIGNHYSYRLAYEQAYLAYQRCLDLNLNSNTVLLKFAFVAHCLFKYEEANTYYTLAEQAGVLESFFDQHCLAQCAYQTNNLNKSAEIHQALLHQERLYTSEKKYSEESISDADTNFAQYTPILKHEYGFVLFRQKKYKDAWVYYDYRHQAENLAKSHPFNLPRWDGAHYNPDDVLLVHGEQGLGDEIMFAVCLPQLVRNANAAGMRIILAVKYPLVQLFKDNFPDCMVIEHNHMAGKVADLQINPIQASLHIPLASLPSIFLNTESDFKQLAVPYLAADSANVARFARLLDIYRPAWKKQLKVGLVWACAKGKTADFDNRYIALNQWRIFSKLNNVLLISLQNAEHHADIAHTSGIDILDLGVEQHHFSDTAALLCLVDVVIGVDTATTHLAGAMGKRVLQPLVKHPDWRHALGDKSIWYENVRYYRQHAADDWHGVFNAIFNDIEKIEA